jgi:hypothetical protein
MTEHPNSYRFIASTGDADRNGNILDLAGWELANYRANPVVLFNHNWDMPPVGRTTRLYTEANRLLAQVEFAPTLLGQELALLNADGYLRAISVGALPLQWDIRSHPEHGFPIGIHSHRQELLELSIVAIPANPATVRASMAQRCNDDNCPVHHNGSAPYCTEAERDQLLDEAFLQPGLPAEAMLAYLSSRRKPPMDPFVAQLINPAGAAAVAQLKAICAGIRDRWTNNHRNTGRS